MKSTGTTGLVIRSALAGLFVLAGFGGLRGSGAPSPAPVQLTPRPLRLPRSLSPRLHDHRGAGTSSNWAGYAVTGSSFTDVKGSWTVPSVTTNPGSKKSYSATWTGIDGDNSNTVEQLGTESDVNAQGKPVYYAWYEMYPRAGYYITFPNDSKLEPGDPINAEVKYVGNSLFALSLVNGSSTHGWTFATKQKLRQAVRTSAEWITEAPSTNYGQVLPLANFGVVNYSDCEVAQSNAAFELLEHWIAQSKPYDEITMANAGGSPKATPGSVSSSNTFSITWNSSN